MIDEMLNYMEENDEYIGWSIWAAGPRKSYLILPRRGHEPLYSLGHLLALLRYRYRQP